MDKVKIKSKISKQGDIYSFYTERPLNIDTEKDYILEIKEFKSQRSLEQNRLLWKLIGLIEFETDNDKWAIYLEGLKAVGQKAEYLLAPEKAEKSLQNVYRLIEKLDKRELNGKEVWVFKCYEGSSKFNSKEMTALVDYFLKQCAELCIYVDLEG